MVRLTIDNLEVELPAGGTILQAARKLGLDVPALCFCDGHQPLTSCMICVVKVKGLNGLVPSCATPVVEGMQVESETDEIRQIRKTGLELLLGDHLGDCAAPCQNTCPAHMDIPLMLRQVAAGRWAEAIATIKKDLALPAVLGRVCPELCERACRRCELDSPASICLVKQCAADLDLASADPYLPPCRPSTGKRVAIVGAGPTGLAAAYHLLQLGHACTVFEQCPRTGGTLRGHIDEGLLPASVLDAEVAVIERLGATFRLDTHVGRDVSPAELSEQFDAALLAVGALGRDETERLGVRASQGRLAVNARTHQTDLAGVFAAGSAVQPSKFAVRSVAQGKAAAACVDQYLRGAEVIGLPRPFNVRIGRLGGGELAALAAGASPRARATPASRGMAGQDPPDLDQARQEALRCLNCDCGCQNDCKLRRYAQAYGASPARYRGEPRTFERHLQHADVIYEPGKCILCGLCVQIATEADEPLGLTFVGRGFDVRVAVPFDQTIAEGLQRVGRQCAQACPTGALSLRSGRACRPDACGTCQADPAPGADV